MTSSSAMFKIVLIFLLVWALWWVSSRNDEVELFNACVKHIKSIRSHGVDIVIDENKYIFEYSLSNFRQLVSDAGLKRKNFLRDLNNIPDIKTSSGPDYQNVYQNGNEMVIYREGKMFGFHIRFRRQKVEVLGIVNDYDILTIHLRREDKTLEEIIRAHHEDPALTNYSGMSSSTDS